MNVLMETGRIVAGAYYDYQETRLSAMNRIRDVVRKRNEGIEFDKKEEKKKEKAYEKRYQDTNLGSTLNGLLAEGKITKDEHAYLGGTIEVANKAKSLEEMYKGLMMQFVNSQEIYTLFLSKVKGLGPVLSANLIRTVGYCDGKYGKDIVGEDGTVLHKEGDEWCPHVSSLWKRCGMHVVNGAAPRRERGKMMDHDPKMKTLCWKIADSFIKQRTPIYRPLYDNEKDRQLALLEGARKRMTPAQRKEFDAIKKRDEKRAYMDRFEKAAPLSLLHAHRRAMRLMVKVFLEHYWAAARTIAKAPVTEPYVIGKLKHRHYVGYMDVIKDWEERRGL